MKFYQKNWFIWLSLILFAPLGVILLWAQKKYNTVTRIILSAVFLILFIIAIATGGSGAPTSSDLASNTLTPTPAISQQAMESTPEPTQEPTPGPTLAPTEAPAKTKTYKIGDSVKAGNLIFTVNSTRTDEGGEFIKPDEGKIYYMVDVTVENTGSESEAVSSLMMFKLFDSDGYNYSVTIGPETKGSVDGEISAGRKLRGELAFEVPEDAKGLELVIEPSLFSSGQIIIELDR